MSKYDLHFTGDRRPMDSRVVLLCFFGSRSSHRMFLSEEEAPVSGTIPTSPKIRVLYSRLSSLERSYDWVGDKLQDPFRVWNHAEVIATAMPISRDLASTPDESIEFQAVDTYFISLNAIDCRRRFPYV
jgi:hypothetical protein